MSPNQNLNDSELISKFEKLASLERKTTAEIVDCLKEIDRRKVYLSLGYTSLYAYLTKGLGYTPSSAQRRIDSARLMRAVPEIKSDLQSGALNLMQISMVAQAIRQKKSEVQDVRIETDDKRSLLENIREKDLPQTQKFLNSALDIELRALERKRLQKDESVRLEITLRKNQMENLERVRELLSHKFPGAKWAEVIEVLADEYIRRKDPLVERPTRRFTAKTKAAPGYVVESGFHSLG